MWEDKMLIIILTCSSYKEENCSIF